MKFNFFRNFLAGIAMWTMVFSPVAYGLQSQSQFDRITQDQIKTMLIDLGLNKKTTYAQFWDRTKHLYPAQVYGEVEAYFKSQPSTVMPAFDVTYTQSAKGEKIPTIKITERGQTYNIEIIGELNEWARVNQVSLSESDLLRLKPAIEKLSPGVTKLETYKKDFARFRGFPRMTPQTWRSMKPEERAAYIVKMRLLWFEARRVIESSGPEASSNQPLKKSKKTSAYDEFLKFLIGDEAHAENQTAARRRQNLQRFQGERPVPEGQFSKTQLQSDDNFGRPCLKKNTGESGGGCIVAGRVAPLDGYYTLTWNSTSAKTGQMSCGCDQESVMMQNMRKNGPTSLDDYSERDVLNSKCTEKGNPNGRIKAAEKGEWIACDPKLYSYKPSDGSPYCVHSMSEAYQSATIFEGSCDKQSQLNTSAYKIEKPGEPNKELTEAEQAKNDYQMTKNFLDGMLKAEKNGLTIDQILKDPKMDPKAIADMDDFLRNTQYAFEEQITKAVQICTKAKNTIDRNFEPACAQLHRRWLFTEKYLAQFRQKSCDPNSTYIGSYDQGEKITSSKTITVGKNEISKTSLNKMSLADLKGLEVCQCKEPANKIVKFGESCAGRTPAIEYSICPKGSTSVPPAFGEAGAFPEGAKELCFCDRTEKQFGAFEDPTKTAEAFKKACEAGAVVVPPPRQPPAADEKKDCAKDYPGASPLNPDTCKCTSGTRSGDFPVKKWKTSNNSNGELYSGPAAEEPDQWSCDDNKVNLWPLAGLGLLALLLLKKKKDNPPTCTGLNQIMKLGYCVCKYSEPGVCPSGAKPDCSGCAVVPTCTSPKSAGTYPACYCPNRDSCVGKNVLLQPTTCVCEPVEGGTTPDNCIGSDCSGGTPPPTNTGR